MEREMQQSSLPSGPPQWVYGADEPGFDFTPATRRDDYATSRAASDALKPVTGKIALEVLAFARRYGPMGITDDDLKAGFPDAPESSYRKRRTELAQRGYLVDSGRTRTNRHGREETVWVLRAGSDTDK
jgi:hypothetical protein